MSRFVHLVKFINCVVVGYLKSCKLLLYLVMVNLNCAQLQMQFLSLNFKVAELQL